LRDASRASSNNVGPAPPSGDGFFREGPQWGQNSFLAHLAKRRRFGTSIHVRHLRRRGDITNQKNFDLPTVTPPPSLGKNDSKIADFFSQRLLQKRTSFSPMVFVRFYPRVGEEKGETLFGPSNWREGAGASPIQGNQKTTP